jgi:hypothetical protein
MRVLRCIQRRKIILTRKAFEQVSARCYCNKCRTTVVRWQSDVSGGRGERKERTQHVLLLPRGIQTRQLIKLAAAYLCHDRDGKLN